MRSTDIIHLESGIAINIHHPFRVWHCNQHISSIWRLTSQSTDIIHLESVIAINKHHPFGDCHRNQQTSSIWSLASQSTDIIHLESGIAINRHHPFGDCPRNQQISSISSLASQSTDIIHLEFRDSGSAVVVRCSNSSTLSRLSVCSGRSALKFKYPLEAVGLQWSLGAQIQVPSRGCGSAVVVRRSNSSNP